MSEPIFSIIIPMKNASMYIGDTIASIVSQTLKDWEVIVVDDCSTDEGKSVAIVKAFQEKGYRIDLVELAVGKGSSGARNEGLKRAKARYLAFFDADDIWHPEYLETMYNYIQSCNSNKAAIFYCGHRRMNSDCTKVILPDYSDAGTKTYRNLLHYCPLFPSITIVDTQKLKEPVLFRENMKSLRDDYVYILDILHQGLTAIGYEDILVDYRMRTDSLTASKRKMILPQWRAYREVKLNFVQCLYFEICWGLNGIKKYFLPNMWRKS